MKILFVSNQKLKSINGYGNPVLGYLIQELTSQGCEIICLEIRSKNFIYKQLELFWKLIMLIISKKRFDLVNVHFGGMTAFITSLFFSKNLILSFHGTDLHGGSFNNKFSDLKAKINVLASKIASKRSARVTVVSKNLLRLFRIKN